jgi:hypothetical protein
MTARVVLAVFLLLCARSAHAELINLGNGMIDDTVQDMTWLQGLNFVQRSGFDAWCRSCFEP